MSSAAPAAASRAHLLRILPAAVIAAMLAGSSGCTALSGFHHNWNTHACCTEASTDLAGSWEGKWESRASGHQGNLRAIITRGEEGRYYARFHARFWKLFTYEYSVPMTAVEEEDGRLHFTGQAYLGELAGGMYYYDGYATATTFVASYRCSKDHGCFSMCRAPCQRCGCVSACQCAEAARSALPDCLRCGGGACCGPQGCAATP